MTQSQLKNNLATPSTKQKIASLSSDSRLYTNLGKEILIFFSLSEYEKLRKCTAKSDFLDCLDELGSSHFEQPAIQVKLVAGVAFVNMYQPRLSKTFG